MVGARTSNGWGFVGMKPILIDGANVAWAHGKSLFPRFEGIKIAADYLVNCGYTVLIVLNSRYHEKWKKELSDLGLSSAIFVVPPLLDSKSDDRIMIDFATNKNCKILTNDKFRDHLKSIPKSKRKSAQEWIDSNIECFHFSDNLFKLGTNHNHEKNVPFFREELMFWLESTIECNSKYDIIDLGNLLFSFYEKKGFSIPDKKQFLIQLKLDRTVKLDKIFQKLLSHKFLCIKEEHDKIGNIVKFLDLGEIELDPHLKIEVTKHLGGLLHDGWVDGSSLAYNLNVALGNSFKMNINSTKLMKIIGMPRNAKFHDLLVICLGETLLNFVTSEPKPNTQWYATTESSHKFGQIGFSSKNIFEELRKENFSILNFPLDHVFHDISRVFEYENNWENGMEIGSIAGHLNTLTGKSVRLEYGSMNKMVSMINFWKYGEEKWIIKNGCLEYNDNQINKNT